MLWVIFPIPDPVSSFKKIHVPIRLAHRHSFNEQINHSDGYNGVITGFKYDNLHPNGAAKLWLRGKKGRQNWWEFHFALYLGQSRTQKTWRSTENCNRNSATTIISGRSHICWLPETLAGMCVFQVRRIFLISLAEYLFFFSPELYATLLFVREGRESQLRHDSSFKIKLILVWPGLCWLKVSHLELWENKRKPSLSNGCLPFHTGLKKMIYFSMPSFFVSTKASLQLNLRKHQLSRQYGAES